MINLENLKMISICNIFVEGKCNSKLREEKVEKAVSEIQDGISFMKSKYYGVKQYAHFDDQDCDCEYRTSPSHGSIVFRIGIKDGENSVNGDYALELLSLVLCNPDIDVCMEINKYLKMEKELQAQHKLLMNIKDSDLSKVEDKAG